MNKEIPQGNQKLREFKTYKELLNDEQGGKYLVLNLGHTTDLIFLEDKIPELKPENHVKYIGVTFQGGHQHYIRINVDELIKKIDSLKDNEFKLLFDNIIAQVKTFSNANIELINIKHWMNMYEYAKDPEQKKYALSGMESAYIKLKNLSEKMGPYEDLVKKLKTKNKTSDLIGYSESINDLKSAIALTYIDENLLKKVETDIKNLLSSSDVVKDTQSA